MRLQIAAAVLLAALTQQASADQHGSRNAWSVSVTGGAGHQFSSGLKDGRGDVEVSRGFIEPGISYAFGRGSRASLAVSAGASDYGFSDGAELGGGEPWDTIREYNVGASFLIAPNGRVRALVMPSVRWRAESGASLDDGRTESVIAGASYRFGDRLSIGPGVGWSSQLGGGSTIFPVLLLDWDITDTLNVTTRPDFAGASGAGLTVTQDLGGGLKLGLTGRRASTRFRLDDTDPAPRGIGQDSGFPVHASISYEPNPGLALQAHAGLTFGGELKLRDSSGDKIEARDYETAPFAGIALRARF